MNVKFSKTFSIRLNCSYLAIKRLFFNSDESTQPQFQSPSCVDSSELDRLLTH